jgi:hypothetical protein
MDGYNDGFDECRNGNGDNGDGDGDGDGGSSSSNRNRNDLAEELCDLLDENRLAAAAIAVGLGYPGLDQAASALCGVVLN